MTAAGVMRNSTAEAQSQPELGKNQIVLNATKQAPGRTAPQASKGKRRAPPGTKLGAELLYLYKGHGLHALLYLLLRQVVQVIRQRPGGAAAAAAAACWGCPCRALRAPEWCR